MGSTEAERLAARVGGGKGEKERESGAEESAGRQRMERLRGGRGRS